MLRPIDMMLPIWPWARRCIQTKKRMSRPIGSSSGRIEAQKLGCGVLNSRLVVSRMSALSSSGSGIGPTVWNSPVSVVKSMPPLLLS